MFTLSLKSANEGNDRVIAISKEPTFKYDNEKGIYTNEALGVKYEVVLQSNKYQQLSIKIKGSDPLPSLTAETLKTANDSGSPVMLIFKNGEVKSSIYNERFSLTATATGAEIASNAAVSQPQTQAKFKINQ